MRFDVVERRRLRRGGGLEPTGRRLRRRRERDEGGFTLVELLVATAILGGAIVMLLGSLAATVRMSDLTHRRGRVEAEARNFAEALRTTPYHNCDLFNFTGNASQWWLEVADLADLYFVGGAWIGPDGLPAAIDIGPGLTFSNGTRIEIVSIKAWDKGVVTPGYDEVTADQKCSEDHGAQEITVRAQSGTTTQISHDVTIVKRK